jgi:CBS domain-containing protein
MKVNELMTREIATVSPEALLKDVAEVLATFGISGLPVCDGDGRLLGVVSERDILFKEIGDGRGAKLELSAGDGKRLAHTAGEAMTAPAVTIGPEGSVDEAATLMLSHRINRLPVVRPDGTLVGIVSRSDLVRAFARDDEEIEHEIVSDILARVLCLEPGRVAVSVVRGTVELEGEVEGRSDAALVERLVGRVPGVVSVAPRLTWRFDDLDRRRYGSPLATASR